MTVPTHEETVAMLYRMLARPWPYDMEQLGHEVRDFFSPRPNCKDCGVGLHRGPTGNWNAARNYICRACNSARTIAWRNANRERFRAYQREYKAKRRGRQP